MGDKDEINFLDEATELLRAALLLPLACLGDDASWPLWAELLLDEPPLLNPEDEDDDDKDLSFNSFILWGVGGDCGGVDLRGDFLIIPSTTGGDGGCDGTGATKGLFGFTSFSTDEEVSPSAAAMVEANEANDPGS